MELKIYYLRQNSVIKDKNYIDLTSKLLKFLIKWLKNRFLSQTAKNNVYYIVYNSINLFYVAYSSIQKCVKFDNNSKIPL